MATRNFRRIGDGGCLFAYALFGIVYRPAVIYKDVSAGNSENCTACSLRRADAEKI